MDVADARTGMNHVKDDVGERIQKLFQEFLENCRREDKPSELKYLEEVHHLIKPERNTLTVSFTDIQEFNQNLSTVVTEEFYRVYPYLCRALRNFVKDQLPDVPDKEYYVSLVDVPTRLKVRELSTFKVGTLIRISGQVVRTHPVHPELVSGTFQCLDCQTIIKDVEQQFKFTQPAICPNAMCCNRSRFLLEPHQSRFIDFQKIRIQETQSELPRGSIPRSMEIIVRAEAVEQAQAGDRCDFTGTLIVVPDVGVLNLPGAKAESGARFRSNEKNEDHEGLQGLKSLGVRELHYRLAFLACSIIPTNASLGGSGDWHLEDTSPEALKKQMSEEEWKKLFEMSTDKNLYQNLVNSLFPTIFGNEEVKRGILLMLFGGVPKVTEEATTLRGDINICIVGDPSAAKSQFLKQVADFCPRAVYTSGKASSAAGLTAAVVKDEESYEFVIEAGALMLADNGICCIDEFDKMDPKDQVAIHEAMEQQTISITKAGVKATLNARTSILAAANPVGGRYDRGRSLRQNINMGAPIMSRFDLFFILIDEANEVTDYAIAKKIVDLHALGNESVDRVYTPQEILRYIMFARQFKPTIGKEAAHKLVQYYKSLRQRDHGGASKTAWRITVRQLESLIRLAEAYARMRCCDVIKEYHVQEAFRLLNKSIIRVEQPDVNLDGDDDVEEGLVDIDADDDEQVETLDSQEAARARRVIPDALDDSQPDRVVDDMDVDGVPPPAPPKKKLKINYDAYKALSNLIIMYMRREENRLEDEGSDSEGLKRSQVVNWYLQEIEDDIETEAELVEKKELIEKILDRLIHHDQVIIPLGRLGLPDGEEDEDPMLVVHPNYVIEF